MSKKDKITLTEWQLQILLLAAKSDLASAEQNIKSYRSLGYDGEAGRWSAYAHNLRDVINDLELTDK